MNLKYYFYIAVILFLASCASQVAPTGGIKDIVPPQVEKSNPENLSINFHASRIAITFDEYVQLNDATNQVFFSPALEGNPVFKLRGKTLLIDLPDTLRKNTTYTVNFGSAIKDITEGNIMLSYQYVFSTGSSIDSLRIQGKLQNALGGKLKPNILVMLYRNATDDSVVAKQRPDYNARTDTSGSFVISHISDGSYKLFALDDQNFNLLYDQPGESVAFYDSSISIADTLGFYWLSLFRPNAEKQSLLNAYSRQPGKATFVFAMHTQHLKIAAPDKELQGVLEFNTAHDTCSYWVNDLKTDSINFILSDDNFNDTVKVKMKITDSKQKVSASSQKLLPSIVSSGGKNGSSIHATDHLLFEFNFPVVARDEARKIFLKVDSVKNETIVQTRFEIDTVYGKKRAAIAYKFLPNKSYSLLIPDSAFSDLYGNSNDTVRINFHTFDEEELGNLNLKISFADSINKTNYYYEFRSPNGALLAKEKLQAKGKLILFKSLAPGNYTLKIVEDKNNNLTWDSGNYWKHLQPEKIFLYSGAITIRPNWDVDAVMKVENR